MATAATFAPVSSYAGYCNGVYRIVDVGIEEDEAIVVAENHVASAPLCGSGSRTGGDTGYFVSGYGWLSWVSKDWDWQPSSTISCGGKGAGTPRGTHFINGAYIELTSDMSWRYSALFLKEPTNRKQKGLKQTLYLQGSLRGVAK